MEAGDIGQSSDQMAWIHSATGDRLMLTVKPFVTPPPTAPIQKRPSEVHEDMGSVQEKGQKQRQE
jgi:hypothetical protein